MDSVLIATTPQRGLHAVATAGQTVFAAYDQIARYLAGTLSPAHAALFAEPNPDPGRGSIDWYAAADGPVGRLAEAEPARRARAEETLARLSEDIRGAAARLGDSAQGGERFLGQLMGLALEIPGEDYVYLVGDQPVLVAWGHLADRPRAERGVLARLVPATPPPGPPRRAPPPAAPALAPAGAGGAALAAGGATTLLRDGYGWLAGLLWALLALLVAAILIVLLSACGVVPRWLTLGGLADFCPVPVVVADDGAARADLARERQRARVLEDELHRLNLALVEAEVDCRRRVRVRPLPVVPGADDEPEVVVTEDVPEEIPADVPEDVTEDVTEELPEDVTEDVTEEVPEDVTEDVTEEVVEDVTEDVAEEVPADVTQDAPAPVPDVDRDADADADADPETVTDPDVETDADGDVETADDPTPRPTTPEDDAAFDERVEREGGERSDRTVTLSWDSDADLDLSIICPDGSVISFSRFSGCGGRLDIDMNEAGGEMSDTPVENVVFGDDAPPGRYRVRVDNYDARSDDPGPTRFRLRIINGEEREIIEGEIAEEDNAVVYYEFDIP